MFQIVAWMQISNTTSECDNSILYLLVQCVVPKIQTKRSEETQKKQQKIIYDNINQTNWIVNFRDWKTLTLVFFSASINQWILLCNTRKLLSVE